MLDSNDTTSSMSHERRRIYQTERAICYNLLYSFSKNSIFEKFPKLRGLCVSVLAIS